MSRTRGFPAESRADARVLVLGSLPGVRSIEAGQYYAHPRNAFWPIMATLFGFDPGLSYRQRIRALLDRRVALWDVLGESRRPGRLDSAIDTASARPNDLAGFLAEHPSLALVAFNGRRAEALFRRLVLPGLDAAPPAVLLPSTSPAHAAMDRATKLAHWSIVAKAAGGPLDEAPPGGFLYR